MKHPPHWRLLAAAALLGSCSLEDLEAFAEAGPCVNDYECSPGMICGPEELCADATAGSARHFGTLELRSTSPDDRFLVSVVSLPTEAEAPADDPLITVTLKGGGEGVAQKLKPRRSRKAPALSDTAARVWRNRMAFDRARREGIDSLIQGAKAGRRTIRGLPYKSGSCGECGALALCWQGECGTELQPRFATGQALDCTLLEVLEAPAATVNVILETAATSDPEAVAGAKAAAQLFLNSLEDQLGYFGDVAHQGDLDRDSDGRLNLLFTRTSVGEGVVGFFDYRDYLPEGDPDTSGNQSDILWVQAPGSGVSIADAVGTLVHEYTHLASYTHRVYERDQSARRESRWLDETIAHTTEDLLGWGVTNIRTVEVALSEWDSTGFASAQDSVAMRGMGYTLLRYLIDSRAAARGATSATSAATTSAAKEILSELVYGDTTGFTHPLFSAEDATTFGDWLTALHATGNPDLEASIELPAFLPVGVADTGHRVGLDPWGTFGDAQQEELELEGLEPEDSEGIPLEQEIDLYVGGSALFLITGLSAGDHELSGFSDSFVAGVPTNLSLNAQPLQ